MCGKKSPQKIFKLKIILTGVKKIVQKKVKIIDKML
jgi:hypothetical protein